VSELNETPVFHLFHDYCHQFVPEKKIYWIDLNEGSKTIAKKETQHTDEIIRFLRYPQRIGEYFSTSDGTFLKWDPQQDVEYDELRIKNKEGKYDFYHLSIFKPLIHRYSFYSDSYKLPATCEDFLMTKANSHYSSSITLLTLQRMGITVWN
jgi:hypothetical protein